jgi:3-oxoacyl-[acyl-carrier-protein] synthase II
MRALPARNDDPQTASRPFEGDRDRFVRCRSAFTDAGVRPDEVGYVNAHGTSTPAGDRAETRVLKHALGEEAARRTPVSSTKDATGHTLGAAGAIEAIFTILALEHGALPPTINHAHPDADCDLDYVPNTPRRQQVDVAVSNSFGFGGHNTAVVSRRL